MTGVFADTVYLVGLNYTRDPHHADALRVQAGLRSAGYLARSHELYLSELVMLEASQELLSHCGFRVARDVLRQTERNHTVLRPRSVDVSNGFYELCSKYGSSAGGRGLGLVDAVSVLLMRRYKIGLILSTDTAFDKVPGLSRVWVHNIDGLRSGPRL